MKAKTREYLVADLFCGAGGSSSGARRAIEELGGTMELVAVNHWDTAIATHSANHPQALHVIEDVSVVDPEAVVKDGRLDLLMASPECKYHSRARGGKPIHDQGRMNPWAVQNWLTKLDVRCVLIENVPEFVDWGPVDEDGRPIKSLKGTYFQAWFLSFFALGYDAEWRMITAADYGDATTRRRFFLMARKDGRPVEWPEPTHAQGDTGMFPGRMPWRGAKEIIDWSDPGKSLLDDPKYRRKPLAVNTRRRIARGAVRFWGVMAPLYIRLLDLPQEEAGFLCEAPEGGECRPFILNRGGENGGNRCKSTDEPVPTATRRGAGYLVQPELAPFVMANRRHNRPKALEEPMPTFTTTTGGGCFLVQPDMSPFVLGQQRSGAARPAAEPIPTVACSGAISLVRPGVVQYYGQSDMHSAERPLSTITAHGGKHALVQPVLVEYYGNSGCASVEVPVPTVTGKDRHGLAIPMAEPARDCPVDPRRLVYLDGEPYLLDIRFRMLRNPELARAMGFDDEEARYQFVGNQEEVTMQIGNAVPVNTAHALVRAILAAGRGGP